MKKLANIIKTTTPKKLAGLGVAAAVGTVVGVKTVTKKRKADLSNLEVKQKAADLLTITRTVGEKVVRGVREDLTTVVESVKEQADKEPACAGKCPHCVIRDTFKPCCKGDRKCSRKEEAETFPEPVKAADVVEAHEEADIAVETAKVEEAVKEVKKPAARKSRTPKAKMTPAEPQPAETPTEEN